MLIPVCYGVYQNENSAASALFFTAVCCIGFGAFVYRHLKYYTLHIKARESFFVAFICWFLVCAAGAVPYLMAGEGYSAADSIFESVSGWTTTGAWAVPTTQMPRCLVLWKAITNWLGGMGLLLLTVTFFPILGAQGQKMASAEVPGIEMEKMSARISDTGKITYRIYIAMSVLELLLLLPSMSPFDAAVNTMSTISTSGILNVHEGIPILASTPYVKTIFTIFSIAGSVNFVMYFFLYNRKWKKALHLVGGENLSRTGCRRFSSHRYHTLFQRKSRNSCRRSRRFFCTGCCLCIHFRIRSRRYQCMADHLQNDTAGSAFHRRLCKFHQRFRKSNPLYHLF